MCKQTDVNELQFIKSQLNKDFFFISPGTYDDRLMISGKSYRQFLSDNFKIDATDNSPRNRAQYEFCLMLLIDSISLITKIGLANKSMQPLEYKEPEPTKMLKSHLTTNQRLNRVFTYLTNESNVSDTDTKSASQFIYFVNDHIMVTMIWKLYVQCLLYFLVELSTRNAASTTDSEETIEESDQDEDQLISPKRIKKEEFEEISANKKLESVEKEELESAENEEKEELESVESFDRIRQEISFKIKFLPTCKKDLEWVLDNVDKICSSSELKESWPIWTARVRTLETTLKFDLFKQDIFFLNFLAILNSVYSKIVS